MPDDAHARVVFHSMLIPARWILPLLTLPYATIDPCSAQPLPDMVSIHVAADRFQGSIPAVWNYFGYDEPNYTYTPNGRKLLGELSALSPQPVYVRVHNL